MTVATHRRTAASAALLLALLPADATASGRRNWSSIPLGSFQLKPGRQEIRVARPYDRFGIIPSPIVFVALFDPRDAPPVPGEISFAAETRCYPTWRVRQPGQMYVIGVAALERDSADEGRFLTLSTQVKGFQSRLALMASGPPDLRLAGDTALGSLEDVVRDLPRSATREYLQATVTAAAGGLPRARRAFARLSSSSDEAVARFSRAALRRIGFAEAEANMAHDVATHYRFGLYAQQCGMFRAARLHFERALVADERHADAWFRLGEMMERCGDPVEDVAAAMERAGQAAGAKASNWEVLATLLRSEKYHEVRDGNDMELRAKLTHAQVNDVRRRWRWVEQMVYGASHGRLKLNTRFVEIADEEDEAYTVEPCGVRGPTDELIPVRGSYDSVVSFRPRGRAQTVGADCGPNGAALSDIGVGASWEVCLREWVRQLDWTFATAEVTDIFPMAENAEGCGHQPIPSLGYGLRAALRYHVPPVAYWHVQAADTDTVMGHIRAWFLSDPVAITADEEPGSCVACQYGPGQTQAWSRQLAVSPTDFVDLKRLYQDAGATLHRRMVTAATAFVWSPARQEVRLWLGFNDGLALWLNARMTRRGGYYAAHKLADRNVTNMVAAAGTLQKGWNRIDCAIEARPEPLGQGFGFFVRICDLDNRPIEGVRVAEHERDVPAMVMPDTLLPPPGSFYKWDEVRDDTFDKLPLLTAGWLREYGGLPGDFRISGRVDGTRGYVSLGSNDDQTGLERGGVTMHAPVRQWDGERDRDLRLNNLLDWNNESVAVYPILRHGSLRHLLVLRPEAVEAFLTCLRESPQAERVLGTTPARERILGYVRVGEGKQSRWLIAAEALLSKPLPIDEEDLLSP